MPSKSKTWQEEYLVLIADCEARESKLNDWERGFLDSVKNRIESDTALTSNMSEKLDEIWERVTKNG